MVTDRYLTFFKLLFRDNNTEEVSSDLLFTRPQTEVLSQWTEGIGNRFKKSVNFIYRFNEVSVKYGNIVYEIKLMNYIDELNQLIELIY